MHEIYENEDFETHKPLKNILLIGDHNCGKTTYIHRLITGDFIKEHKPTLDNPKSKITIGYMHTSAKEYKIYTRTDSNYFLIETNFDNYMKFIENFEQDIDGVIIMYDCTTRVKGNIINEIVEFFIDIPIVICMNKYMPKVICKQYNLDSKKYKYSNIYEKEHITMCIKSNHNIDKPFFLICREILNKLKTN